MSRAAERIQGILDAAEKAASEIRADAEREAAAYLEQRRAEADEYLDQRRAETEALAADRSRRLEQLLAALENHANELLEQRTAIASTVREALAELRGTTTQDAAPDAEEATPVAAVGPAPITDDETAPSSADAPEASPLREAPGLVAAVPDSNGGDEPHQAALIRATQLAVSGADRDHIERTIADEFEVADPDRIVREILD